MRPVCAAVALCAWLGGVIAAHAHAFSPSLLAVHELATGDADVTWKTPRLRVMGARVRPVLPPRCRETAAPTTEDTESAVIVRWRVACGPTGLIGGRIAIEGLESANTNALIRVALCDGRLIQRVVTSAAPSFVIPAAPGSLDVVRDYGRHGVAYILGLDHIVFVLGLLLLVPATWALAKTLAAFTLGHSATLSAAVFGLVAVPLRPIEVVVAITILALATELARAPVQSLLRRAPWAVAFVFGLVHGLGFAGALRDLGLPSGDLPLALLAFNGGIEIGQIFIVCVLLGGLRIVGSRAQRCPSWARQVPVYVMGALAAFWCFERTAALLR